MPHQRKEPICIKVLPQILPPTPNNSGFVFLAPAYVRQLTTIILYTNSQSFKCVSMKIASPPTPSPKWKRGWVGFSSLGGATVRNTPMKKSLSKRAVDIFKEVILLFAKHIPREFKKFQALKCDKCGFDNPRSPIWVMWSKLHLVIVVTSSSSPN